jgi:hypothetical protein
MTEICIEPVTDSKAKLIDCSTGKEIDICSLCGGGGAVKRARGKRAPSPYNIFMGSCVKGKAGDIKSRFKACVEEWKKKK